MNRPASRHREPDSALPGQLPTARREERSTRPDERPPDAFYALWLDPTMTYSCALWAEGDGLLQAQLRKIDYHVAQAAAASADRVLDLGCGWGGTLRRLTGTHGVRHAVGLTRSPQQAALARARAGPRCEVRQEDWAAHRPDAPYDAILCIGAFEHVAGLRLSRDEKVAGYRAFFSRCRSWLRPGGLLTLQTIALGYPADGPGEARDALRMALTLLPGSQLPTLAEIHEAGADLLTCVRMRNDHDDYARTCQCWLQRLLAARDRAVALVGDATVTEYEQYLRASVRLFELGCMSLLRVTFRR
ncbi:class I SAM-dependent methyltransferase [Streptomyces cinnamoneus]|uniref:class I SAM-dependent methyltransferase n=1 Tax=Streptomyces cinnamoneus TaxID=53446 RepID=UPI0034176132